jgi:putative ABC transport system permease protein
MTRLGAILARLFGRRVLDPLERQIQDEIRHHLEMRTEANVRAGMNREEARADAERRFGDPRRIRQEGRAILAGAWWSPMVFQDLSYALRGLTGSPGFTLTVVVTLALGIGANTATFSFANAVLRHEPPVMQPGRLVRLFVRPGVGGPPGNWSYPDLADVRSTTRSFSGLVGELPRPMHLGYQGANQRVWGSLVSGDYFNVLGVSTHLGRTFVPEEYGTREADAVAVLSYGLWAEEFGADPAVLGSSIQLDGQPFTVVGVAPRDFTGTNVGLSPRLWVPLAQADLLMGGVPLLDARGYDGIPFVMGRLAPGVPASDARQEAQSLLDELDAQYRPAASNRLIVLLPERLGGVHPRVRAGVVRFVSLIFVIVGAILLLACANVAGLLLARATGRGRELGVRVALGAGRGRIIRQLLVESLLLGLVAGLAGLGLADGLVGLVEHLPTSDQLPLSFEVKLDWVVLFFTLVTSMLTTLLFGLAPAVTASRVDPAVALRGGLPWVNRTPARGRDILVIGQVTLSVALVIAGGAAIRGLQTNLSHGLGTEASRILVAAVDLDLQGYRPEEAHAFQRSLKESVSALPSVEDVAVSAVVPLSLRPIRDRVAPQGLAVRGVEQWPVVDMNAVDGGFFAVMGVPLISGRTFSDGDDSGAPAVVLVNETFARRFWPNRDPLGRTVRLRSGDAQVVGVVTDGKYLSLGEAPTPYLYRPIAQLNRGAFFLHARVSGGGAGLPRAIADEILTLEPGLPPPMVEPLTGAVAVALLPSRLAARIISGFALVALLLAATGLYGTLAFRVQASLRDIGIRMAIGAEPRTVMLEVLTRGAKLALPGLALGSLAGAALTRIMVTALPGVDPMDGVTYAVGVATLLGVSLAASWLPARQATAADPLRALQAD